MPRSIMYGKFILFSFFKWFIAYYRIVRRMSFLFSLFKKMFVHFKKEYVCNTFVCSRLKKCSWHLKMFTRLKKHVHDVFVKMFIVYRKIFHVYPTPRRHSAPNPAALDGWNSPQRRRLFGIRRSLHLRRSPQHMWSLFMSIGGRRGHNVTAAIKPSRSSFGALGFRTMRQRRLLPQPPALQRHEDYPEAIPSRPDDHLGPDEQPVRILLLEH